jgi:hypothetical protein
VPSTQYNIAGDCTGDNKVIDNKVVREGNHSQVMKTKQILRVVVASPGDVQVERD